MLQLPQVVFGTAQLFGLADEPTSREVLAAAWDAGFRRFDTAPSYGGGRAEAELGAFLGGRRADVVVGTKVGLAPAMGTRSGGRQLVRLARTVLPGAVTRRLQSATQARASGRFGAAEVRSGLDESLRRLGGRVDRYLLHEVTADDVTDELLEVLRAAVATGDVGAVGVATANAATAAAVAAGDGVLTVAQHAAGPLDDPVRLPDSVVTRVGHGLLGAGGGQLQLLQRHLEESEDLAGRWDTAVEGTVFSGRGGLARALLARRPPDVTEVLVATTRPARVAETAAAAAAGPLPHLVDAALAAVVSAARAGTH